MKKLMLAVLAAASLGAGSALAQDAESLAGGAWRVTPDTGPIPGTPEYYGNSGWPPQPEPYRYYDRRGYPVPYAYRSAEPAYPHLRPHRGDRDGDGVRNRKDRYPYDPGRW